MLNSLPENLSHQGPISGLSAFQDRLVATAGYDNKLILWDAKTRKPLARGSHDHLVNQCSFSPDGEKLVSASSDYSARVWSVPDMRLLLVLKVHDDDVMQAEFSKDGSMIATCSYDSSLAIFKNNGTLLHHLRGHQGLIERFDWSHDNKMILSCGTDGTIRKWDAHSGKCIEIITTEGYDMDALVTLSGGGFIVGNNEGEIQLLPSNGVNFQVDAHNSSVKRLIMDSSENLLLSLGYDRMAVLWQVTESELVESKRIIYPNPVWARSAAFLDEHRIIFATFGSTYAIWDIKKDQWELDGYVPSLGLNAVQVIDGDVYSIGDAGILFKNNNEIGGPKSLCNFIEKFEDIFITGGQNGCIYNAVTGEELYQHTSPHNCAVRFERNGKPHVAVGSYSGDIIVLSSENNEVSYEGTYKVHENAIKGMATDGQQIFTGCADGELCMVDTHTLKHSRLSKDAHEGILNDVSWYAEGFATISRDLTLRLWKGNDSSVFKTHHCNSIKCVAASEDGMLIATGSYGGTIDIFNVKTQQWKDDLSRPTTAGISSLTWNSEGQCFIASSYDGNLYTV